MSVAETSIEAYHDHRDSGKVGKQAQHLLNSISVGRDYSRRELTAVSGLELSSVCGRVNELLAIGLLVERDARPCRITGKRIKPVAKPGLF